MELDVLRRWTTSTSHILHGPRRAGKTLKQTHLACLYLITCVWINKCFAHLIGTPAFPQPLHVWSTYPIEFMYRPSDDGATWPGASEPMLLKTIPLDFHKLIVFSPEITWGFLIIDELNQRADRQQWQSGGQPLLMERLVQLGKSHLSMTATVQSLQWVNPRYMFQSDMSTACRDAYMTAWGRANGLLPGDLTFLYSKDLSGGSTGYMYEENGLIHETMFHGKWVQPFYKTDDIQDPWEHYESIKIKRQTYEVDPNAKQEIDSYPQDVAILDQVLFEYVRDNNIKPERAEFLKTCQKMGMNMDKSEAISYIIDCYDVKKYTSNGIVKLDFTKAKENVVKQDYTNKIQEGK